MSESLPTQFYERRKKSRRDVDVSEGGSSNPPPQRRSKRIVHCDYPRDHMHIEIEIEIEEEEEHIVTSSEDDDVEDENYRISPRAARGAAFDDDEDEDIEDKPIRQVEYGCNTLIFIRI
jgi:hypothetical protein